MGAPRRDEVCYNQGPSTCRRQLLDHIATRIPAGTGESCVLVAVDGADGSGKTVFADELAAAVRQRGRPVIRVSADDFHNVRAIRYRRGRESHLGFWLDSYNYGRLITDVLEPLGPGGDRRYRPVAHDLETDEVLSGEWLTAPAHSVVIVDGLFLHRSELCDRWDYSIFLDVPFQVTAARMAIRDGSNPNPAHPGMRRYVDAQLLYFDECSPKAAANVVVDNIDFDAPRVINDETLQD
jgi:uridine kinase